MVAIALAAFAFAFALVPLYRIACEKVFGIRLASGPTEATGSLDSTVATRNITVEFDGAVNPRLPWTFAPQRFSMQVQPGRQYEAQYLARNTSDRAIVGNAVPSVAPARASGYFSKTECFCFTAQTLQAGESRMMPVRFVVSPDLPPDVRTITLSYTFFKNAEQTAALQAASAARAAP